MCACPGKHRPLGTAATCEEACFGTRPGGAGGAAEPVLRESGPPNPQLQAWRQLNCAAYIMRHALAGVMESGDYRNLRELSGEASKAMDGGRLSVQCTPAPPFPRGSGAAPDMEKLKQAQVQMIGKAQSLGARMEQREAVLSEPARKAMKDVQASAPAAGARPETDIERLRRVQRALNRINETKLDGKSTEAIRQQEKDRAAMGRLLLVAEKIEKGDVDLGIDLAEEAPARRRAPRGR